MGDWSRVWVCWPVGLLGLLIHSGCSGASAPLAPMTQEPAPGIPVAPIIVVETTAPSNEPSPSTPATGDESTRGLETLDLNGKWFGALDNFEPLEPPANNWNIDLDITQDGSRLNAVVIISELIPIGHNIWDVFIRLDARGEGVFDNGYGALYLFNDVKVAMPTDPPVVNGGPLPIREIDFAQAIVAPGPDDTLVGRLIIHWRLVEDHTTTWVSHCDLSGVELVTGQGGGGPG